MRLIDEQYTRTPFYGIRRMRECLKRQGYQVNHKRVARLMRKMGIVAVYPKPRLSKRNAGEQVYPYLLRNFKVDYPDHVWATDITYIRMKRGFIYLTAVMDWFSRYVISWRVSITLEVDFCINALERALLQGCPVIFNSDQGSQFTSPKFTGVLLGRKIKISMDGRGRCFDNIFVERLWRSVKYEEVYLNNYETVPEAVKGLDRYFLFYNEDRPHQSLDYKTPGEVYRECR